MKNKIWFGPILLLAATLLTACAEENKTENTEETTHHAGMDHSSTGEIPEGLKNADNPTYKVGSRAIIEGDHMEGMRGAEATIAGAYDTVAYVVSYTPTNGGEVVEDHKWVIQEEIEGAKEELLNQVPKSR